MIIWLWWVVSALAAPVAIVHTGDTVESIAASLGDPGLAADLRVRNRISPGEQPAVGTLLALPDRIGQGDCEPSALIRQHEVVRVTLPGHITARRVPDYTPLPVGTKVCTDQGAFARIRLAGLLEGDATSDEITLMPSSCITIRSVDRVASRRRSLIDLQRGALSVADVSSDGTVLVQTPAGISGADKGGFRVTVEASQATRTEALTAKVSTLAAGVEVELPEGFGGRTELGEAPGDPVALLVPGELLEPGMGQPQLRGRFVWTAVAPAAAYGLEVAHDRAFSQVVMADQVALPIYAPSGLLLPYRPAGLWWRVTSFDELGFQGLPSEPFWMTFPDWVAP